MRGKTKLKKKEKANKGITLIALVITIIVLLILAAVSIATLTGENGILTKANTAKTRTILEEEKEQIKLAYSTVIADKLEKGDKTAIAASELETELKKLNPDVIVTSDGNKIKITFDKTGNTYTIDSNGNITGSVNSGGNGGTENPPIEDTIIPGEIVTGENKEYTKNGTAVIPEGFIIVPGCDNVSEGLVISDDAGDTEIDSDNIIANGNQFVWIPVTNMENFKAIEGYSDGSLQNIISYCSEPFASGDATEESEYNEMKQSVTTNQGFYIGRYEAGQDNERNLVIKKNSPVYNSIKWGTSMSDTTGGAVEKSKNFINDKTYKNSVTSTLCYGVQWDATMQFFDSNYLTGTCDENSYVRNSTDKGNYSGDLINTGSNENYKVKNIYDMAGNVNEWTMEVALTNRRVRRGGGYALNSVSNPVSERYSHYPDILGVSIGFRVALYL